MSFISFTPNTLAFLSNTLANFKPSTTPQQDDDDNEKGFLEEAWDFLVGAEGSPDLPPVVPLPYACGGSATGIEYKDIEFVELPDADATAKDTTGKPEITYQETSEAEAGSDPCDQDGDGFLLAPYCGEGHYDCNDLSDKIFPGADEVPCNGVDEDCDDEDLTDLDGDGVSGCSFSEPKDCDEKDKTIFPGAKEKTCDQIDQNCNGDNDEDWDCDGYTIDDGDCNDGNSQVNPGAKDKICDTDLNCDGKIDEKDVDKDGYGACPWSDPLDCNDNNVNVHPGAEETPCNDLDEDCDGEALVETDEDKDGATKEGICKAKDCDDNNPKRAPGLLESCDGIDNDCDEIIDEGCEPECVDADLDSFGENCIAGADCDDANPLINPLAKELCNSVDDDCDGQKDEGFNVGEACQIEVGGCVNYGNYICGPNGLITICDAAAPVPEEEIPCNDVDEDCDGIAFQGTDKDGDGYKIEGGLCVPMDCDDGDPDVHPDAPPGVCVGIDYNCDGKITNAKIGEDVRITDTAENEVYPSLIWTGSEYGLVWTSQGINFVRLDEEGNKIINIAKIINTPGWPYNLKEAIAWNGSEYGVCWTNWYVTGDTSTGPIPHFEGYFTRIGLDGSKIENDTKIGNNSKSGDPSITFTGTTYGITWQDDIDTQYKIYFNRLDETGQKMQVDEKVSDLDGWSSLSSLVWTGTNYGVSWWNNYNNENAIYFARINADGTKIGNEIKITNNAIWSADSSLAWDGFEYGLAWSGKNKKIYFTRIASSGNNLNDNIIIDDNGILPSLTSSGSQFGISWSHYEDDSNSEIYFSLLDEFGNVLGNNLKITNAPGNSSFPSLAWGGNAHGIAWKDERDGNSEIYFARIGCQ